MIHLISSRGPVIGGMTKPVAGMELMLYMGEDEVRARIELDGFVGEGWSRVYNELARTEAPAVKQLRLAYLSSNSCTISGRNMFALAGFSAWSAAR